MVTRQGTRVTRAATREPPVGRPRAGRLGAHRSAPSRPPIRRRRARSRRPGCGAEAAFDRVGDPPVGGSKPSNGRSTTCAASSGATRERRGGAAPGVPGRRCPRARPPAPRRRPARPSGQERPARAAAPRSLARPPPRRPPCGQRRVPGRSHDHRPRRGLAQRAEHGRHGPRRRAPSAERSAAEHLDAAPAGQAGRPSAVGAPTVPRSRRRERAATARPARCSMPSSTSSPPVRRQVDERRPCPARARLARQQRRERRGPDAPGRAHHHDRPADPAVHGPEMCRRAVARARAQRPPATLWAARHAGCGRPAVRHLATPPRPRRAPRPSGYPRRVPADDAAEVAAIFDLDKTIIATSSATAFSKPLRSGGLLTRRAMLRAAYAQAAFLLGQCRRGRRPNGCGGAISNGPRLGRRRVSRDRRTRRSPRPSSPSVFAEAVALIDGTTPQGHDVVIASASGDDVVRPIADLLGVDHVVATRMEVRRRALHGRPRVLRVRAGQGGRRA